MKIAIDCRGINWYHGTGIGTYTNNLVKNMVAEDKNHNYTLFWSGGNYIQYENQKCNCVMTSSKHHRFFQESYFPRNIEKENIDLYHIPQNGIGLTEKIPCKKVVTIHDLIPYTMPETVGSGYLLKFLKEMPYIIENSEGILTVSEFSKKDILRFFPIDPNKIFVTPLAANEMFKPLNKSDSLIFVKKKYNISNDFALYIGGFSDRKNVHGLIEAFSKAYPHLNKDFSLVILGSYRDSSQKLIKLVKALNMERHVIFTGFIPDEELPTFYNAATAFIYPSFYEGFGLPPLEAISCGTPVITSNLTSIPEIVDNAGILINPYNTDELQTSIEKLLNDINLQESLRTLSLKKAKEFSWNKTASLTLDAYEKINL